jgi:hypothetical protein
MYENELIMSKLSGKTKKYKIKINKMLYYRKFVGKFEFYWIDESHIYYKNVINPEL